MACPDTEGRGNYPLEPFIKDVETWKIHASFLIPAVRSMVFLGQGYTSPPDPRCPTCSLFLPDDLSHQDVQQQPFLLTIAYAQGLQYWVEGLNLPADLDFCPLVRSVLELKERVKEHVVFSKQDVFQGLGKIDPGTMSQWPQPTITGIGSAESNSAGIWGTCGTSSSSSGSLPERGRPQASQASFKWRTSWLAKMQAQLRLQLKLPPPPHQLLNWPVPLSHLIRQKWKGSTY